jgi:hypothetical protein
MQNAPVAVIEQVLHSQHRAAIIVGQKGIQCEPGDVGVDDDGRETAHRDRRQERAVSNRQQYERVNVISPHPIEHSRRAVLTRRDRRITQVQVLAATLGLNTAQVEVIGVEGIPIGGRRQR